MKKKGADRYRDPEAYLRKQRNYIRSTYKLIQLAFDKIKDAELIADLEMNKGSKTERVREWYRCFKNSKGG